MSRILIVEDDQLQGQLLLEILVSFGNTPTLVETISDALRLFNEQKFDIVVTDYHLGGADASLHANGADLIAYIRSEDKSACDHCVNSSASPYLCMTSKRQLPAFRTVSSNTVARIDSIRCLKTEIAKPFLQRLTPPDILDVQGTKL